MMRTVTMIATDEELAVLVSSAAERGAKEKICWPPWQFLSSLQTQPKGQ